MSLQEWWWIYDLHEAKNANSKSASSVDWDEARLIHAEKMSVKNRKPRR